MCSTARRPPMDFDESPEDVAFRAEARAWLARPEVREVARPLAASRPNDEVSWLTNAKTWQAFLADHGWACITWPSEYGGRDGTPGQAAIFAEEMARIGVIGGAF